MRHGHPLINWFERELAPYKAALDELREMVGDPTMSQILRRLYDLFRIREQPQSAGYRQTAENLEKLGNSPGSCFTTNRRSACASISGR